MKSSRGFSIIELLIIIAIMAVLAALAIPSFADFFEKSRLRGAAEMVYEQLIFAKTEATKRSRPIVVDFSADDSTNWALGITDDYRDDFSPFDGSSVSDANAGCDSTVLEVTDIGNGVDGNDACTIEIDNDPSVDYGPDTNSDGIPDPDGISDLLLFRTGNIDENGNLRYRDIVMKGIGTNDAPLFNSDADDIPSGCPPASVADNFETCFEPFRGTARNGTIVLASQKYTLHILIGEGTDTSPGHDSISGKVRICIPTDEPNKISGYPDC